MSKLSDFAYEETRRISYDADEHGRAIFLPVCPGCGRYVKADETISINGFGEIAPNPNATCKKCGRVQMPFEGYF